MYRPRRFDLTVARTIADINTRAARDQAAGVKPVMASEVCGPPLPTVCEGCGKPGAEVCAECEASDAAYMAAIEAKWGGK